MSCSWVGLLRATGYSPSYMNYFRHSPWKPLVSVLQNQTVLLLTRNFFRNKAVSDGAISFYLDHFVSTRVSKFTVPLSISHTAVGLKTRSPLLLGLGGFVGHSVLSYLKWVVSSLSSKAWVSYLKTLDDRITGLQIVRQKLESRVSRFC